MAKERLPVSAIREVLRLRWAQKLSVRQTAQSVGRSTGKVSQTTSRAAELGLDWEAVEGLDDEELERRLFGAPKAAGGHRRPRPDPLWIHLELKKPEVTRELLHLEYLQEHPDGYRYTAFCDVYRAWRKKRHLVMRHEHPGGDKTFTDYSGTKPSIIDRDSGQRIEVELFVAVLGGSSLTYVEATATQQLSDWIGSNVRALEYFGGATEMTVSDQHRAAVSEPCRYEPGLHRTYAEFGRHYGMAVVPARPRKPRDKAKVERAVQVAQRWILAKLRHERFFSLEELNGAPMKKYGGLSRRELFERVERHALQPLPASRFEPCEWLSAPVGADYHVKVHGHFYSVPWELAHERLEVRVTASTVEAFVLGRRVASHARSDEVGGATTHTAHMPAHHRWWAEKDPEPMRKWAASVGPYTEAMLEAILGSNFNREQTFRSATGLRSLADRYEAEQIERACERALRFGGCSYKNVERILKLGLRTPAMDDESDDDARSPIDHDNVRGPSYYH